MEECPYYLYRYSQLNIGQKILRHNIYSITQIAIIIWQKNLGGSVEAGFSGPWRDSGGDTDIEQVRWLKGGLQKGTLQGSKGTVVKENITWFCKREYVIGLKKGHFQTLG